MGGCCWGIFRWQSWQLTGEFFALPLLSTFVFIIFSVFSSFFWWQSWNLILSNWFYFVSLCLIFFSLKFWFPFIIFHFCLFHHTNSREGLITPSSSSKLVPLVFYPFGPLFKKKIQLILSILELLEGLELILSLQWGSSWWDFQKSIWSHTFWLEWPTDQGYLVLYAPP